MGQVAILIMMILLDYGVLGLKMGVKMSTNLHEIDKSAHF